MSDHTFTQDEYGILEDQHPQSWGYNWDVHMVPYTSLSTVNTLSYDQH